MSNSLRKIRKNADNRLVLAKKFIVWASGQAQKENKTFLTESEFQTWLKENKDRLFRMFFSQVNLKNV